jgi:two-component system, cell cycle sensor histidine kinase and response regulator CckA
MERAGNARSRADGVAATPAPPAPALGADPAVSPAPAAELSNASELELLRTVLNRTTARIACYDREGRIVYITPAMAQRFGRTPDQLVGRTWPELGIPADLIEPLEAFRRSVVETGKPASQVVSGDVGGQLEESEFVSEPIFGADGTVTGTVVTSWDVTELGRAARRIAQLDRVYAILTDINQAIVRIRDRDRILSEACRIAVEIGGFSLAWIGRVEPNGDVRVACRAGADGGLLDQVTISARDEPSGRGMVGTSIREDRTVVIGDVEHDPRLDFWREQLASLGFRTAASFPMHINGRPIGAFTLYSSQPGYFDAQEIGLFEELASDLSFALESLEAERGRAAAEEALRDSERRYRGLFESNPLPMWVYDVETLRFLDVNHAAVHTYGYSRAEFLRMSLADIRPPEDVPAMLANVASPGVEGFRPSGVWRHVRKDGTLVDVEVTGHDVDFDGRRARLISAIDVTERRRLEAQLAEATRMEAMGHLAGGIAHDFNNLLTAVNGYSELLATELGDSPLAEDAREIRRAGGRAAELTRQVLAFARRQVMTPHPVDLNEVVAGVSQMLRRLIGEQIELVIRLEKAPAVVMADPGQLEQVLVNLAINARDAMPHGGLLEIAVRRVGEAAEAAARARAAEPNLPPIVGPAFVLSVKDSGLGMDAETLRHAFEPFFTTKKAGGGTGLGLSSVYGIVGQSKGEIWAESEVGHGTKISVLLAAVDAKPEPLAGVPIHFSDAHPSATILVVEDEHAVRALVVSALERSGYRVLVAGSPSEAVALTDGLDVPIDLLLTDLIMPETNGQALAGRLLAMRPSMKVVLMSGYGAGLGPIPTDGSFHFIAKPFGRGELTALVAKVLAEG